MKDQFVPYEIAMALTMKGFDEPCIKVYDTLGYLQDEKIMDELSLEKVAAPLWQQAINWLDKREVYCTADPRVEDGLLKWYPVLKTLNRYEFVVREFEPRGTKINALTDLIEYSLTLI